MPVIHIDKEQAQLIEVAVTMLEGALLARVERVDPDKVISNSLHLQSNKLATVRTLLKLGEPPKWSELDPKLQAKAARACQAIAEVDATIDPNTAWETLRGILAAPAFP